MLSTVIAVVMAAAPQGVAAGRGPGSIVLVQATVPAPPGGQGPARQPVAAPAAPAPAAEPAPIIAMPDPSQLSPADADIVRGMQAQLAASIAPPMAGGGYVQHYTVPPAPQAPAPPPPATTINVGTAGIGGGNQPGQPGMQEASLGGGQQQPGGQPYGGQPYGSGYGGQPYGGSGYSGGGYGGGPQGGGYGGGPYGARPPYGYPGMPPRERMYLVARAGDTTYAVLDRGFNSEDPQAPIFATITDVDQYQRAGPLNGVRLFGNVTYSHEQAAIVFQQMILLDGRQIPIKALAISDTNARTGVAKEVDNHVIERYGSLLLGSFVQGAGQVGQTLMQTDRPVTVDPVTGATIVQGNANVREAAIGALLPAGQALTAAAAQNFNQPATISSPAGSGIGIVFIDAVVLPASAVLRAPSVRAAYPVNVRDTTVRPYGLITK